MQEKIDAIWGQYLAEKHMREEIEMSLAQLLTDNDSTVPNKNGFTNAKVVIENLIQENDNLKGELKAIRMDKSK